MWPSEWEREHHRTIKDRIIRFGHFIWQHTSDAKDKVVDFLVPTF